MCVRLMIVWFSHDSVNTRPFDQKLKSTLIYLFYLYTTTRQKYMVVIDFFFYVHATIRQKYVALFH